MDAEAAGSIPPVVPSSMKPVAESGGNKTPGEVPPEMSVEIPDGLIYIFYIDGTH